MTLQKSLEFANDAQSREIFNYNDIAVEAKAIIDAAKTKASKIVSQSVIDAGAACEAGKKKGFDEGFLEGKTLGAKEGHEAALQEKRVLFQKNSDDLVKMFRVIIADFGLIKETIQFEAEQNTLLFAVEIGRKIVKSLAIENDEVLKENVINALELVASKTDIQILLNPEDIKKIELLVNDPQSVLAKVKGLQFIGDKNIDCGGCKIDNEFGSVDAQIDTQVDRIAKQIVMKQI